MMFINISLLLLILTMIIKGQKSCEPREITGQSVVCVCNVTYCDEIVREAPTSTYYVTYTSSENGSRFLKETGWIQLRFFARSENNDDLTLTLDLNTKYQSVEGFGGAVTDAASMNWKNLNDFQLKQHLIDSYFSKSGLQYNMLRVPIGGCDFSTHPYAYNEEPKDDLLLTNFSLTIEDYAYKIPMIHAIMLAAVEPVHIVATTWSPPLWMKTNEVYGEMNQLKPEYYQTYADYHLKFVEAYAAEGIKIWGITTTNEPINGMIGFVTFNSLGWSPLKQGEWIANNLGPTIRNSSFADLKIIAGDDQRASIPWWFNMMLATSPEALQYIDGVAVHFYTDFIIPANILSLISDNYPEKFILSTEACEGATRDTEKVLLGSWERAKHYIIDIIENLNNNVIGWIDWNLCLNMHGGPNWVGHFVDSPIIVFPKQREFLKQPMYYAIGHFSKFLPRGSQRIKVTSNIPSSVINVAFLTPHDTVVVVLYNDGGPTNVTIQLMTVAAAVSMEASSVVTVEFSWHSGSVYKRAFKGSVY